MRGSLCVCLFFFWPPCMTWEILVSRPGLHRRLMQWNPGVLTMGPPGHPLCVFFPPSILRAAPVAIILILILKWRTWDKFLSPKCGEIWNVKLGWWSPQVITGALSSYTLGLDRTVKERGWLAPGSQGCSARAGSIALSVELEPSRGCLTAGGPGELEKCGLLCPSSSPLPGPPMILGKGVWETYVGNISVSK